MTKLQEKLLKLKELREQNAKLFTKSDDPATLSAEDIATIKSNNSEIEKLETEVKGPRGSGSCQGSELKGSRRVQASRWADHQGRGQ